MGGGTRPDTTTAAGTTTGVCPRSTGKWTRGGGNTTGTAAGTGTRGPASASPPPACSRIGTDGRTRATGSGRKTGACRVSDRNPTGRPGCRNRRGTGMRTGSGTPGVRTDGLGTVPSPTAGRNLRERTKPPGPEYRSSETMAGATGIRRASKGGGPVNAGTTGPCRASTVSGGKSGQKRPKRVSAAMSAAAPETDSRSVSIKRGTPKKSRPRMTGNCADSRASAATARSSGRDKGSPDCRTSHGRNDSANARRTAPSPLSFRVAKVKPGRNASRQTTPASDSTVPRHGTGKSSRNASKTPNEDATGTTADAPRNNSQEGEGLRAKQLTSHSLNKNGSSPFLM